MGLLAKGEVTLPWTEVEAKRIMAQAKKTDKLLRKHGPLASRVCSLFVTRSA